jgi:hypothetical protein
VRAAAQLDNPNVVRALDADRVGETHFFVMEYALGTDLAKLVQQQGPLPVAQACDYIRQAALGLQHAFEKGLVHRDIKPHNLLVTTQGVVKVLDLGLARLTHVEEDGASGSGLTDEGVVMGTADYMAPEQALDPHGADIRADLYSLGCTLYFLLTGQVPFPEGNLTQKIARHQMVDPPPVERLRPEVPPAVSAVVRRLLAKRPEDRYQTPAELAEVLAQVGAGPALAAAAGGTEAAPAAPAADTEDNAFAALVPGDTVEGSDAGRRRQRRAARRWLLLGLDGVLVLCLLGGLLALALRPGPPGLPPPAAPAELVLRSEASNARVAVERDGREVGVLDLREGRALELEADEYTLRLAGDGGGVRLPIETVTLEPGKRHVLSLESIPLAPPGQLALVSRPTPLQGVKGWTITTQTGRGAVAALTYHPTGRYLAVANRDGVIRLMDPASGRLTRALVGHTARVAQLAWSPDGRKLLSAGADRTVRLWEVESGRLMRTLPVPAGSVVGRPTARRSPWASAGSSRSGRSGRRSPRPL